MARVPRRVAWGPRRASLVGMPLLLDAATAAAERAVLPASLPALRRTPRGDGHAVLVLPGLMAGDWSTTALRRFLRARGYAVHGWGLGTNVGPDPAVIEALETRLADLERSATRRVSIVGWSLGGLYARHLARTSSDRVRLVVTLGSPLRAAGRQGPLPVPSTSVYSRGDRIVPWRSSLETGGPRSESVEVRGSHVGLGTNPAALAVVADRLAQPEGTWRPFDGASYPRLFPR